MAFSKELLEIKPVRTTPYLRIVPNGFVLDEAGAPLRNEEGKVTLKASLILTPTADASGAMDFAQWPNAMAKLLEDGGPGGLNGFRIRILPLAHQAESDCIDPASAPEVPAEDTRVSRPQFLSEYIRQSGRLTALWQNSISPEGTATDWEVLLRQIDSILNGNRVSPGAIKPGETDVKPDPVLGTSGQFTQSPPKEGRQCDTILSVPRADAAIVLEMQRAKELVGSIGDQGERLQAPPEATPVVSDPVGGLGEDADLTEESVADAVKARKADRLSKLWDALADERAEAREAFAAATSALQNGAPAEICSYRALSPQEALEGAGRTTAGAESPLNKVRQATEYAQWPQHKDDAEDGRAPSPLERAQQEASDKQDRLSQTYFGIEGNPGLARAFGLVFDIEIDLAPDMLADARFALLNACLRSGTGVACPAPWSLTKLSRYGEKQLAHGWPATSSEYTLWCKSAKADDPTLPAHCIPQFDGVVNMGGVPAKGKRLPRYDITTLDISAALDAEQNWLEAIEERRRDAATGVQKALSDLLSVGPDFQSSGLTLLCRSAAADAVRKLASIQEKLSQASGAGGCIRICTDGPYVIHDAEDLTNGFRLMVGVPDGSMDGPTDWRSLMGRFYTYGGTGEGGDLIERLLRRAIGAAGSPERVEIESAMQAVPSRDIATGGTKVETLVDETVGFWDGTPGGVACGQVFEAREDLEDVMCFGRRVDVPRNDEVSKPPLMRNGRPFRFGLQTVFAGGRGVPVLPKESIASPDDVRARLYYPSRGLAADSGDAQAVPYVRSLRHTRLGAPSLLLPVGHARTKNGPMGFDSSGKMIVRSLRATEIRAPEGREAARDRPTISQRLVVVPNVPQALAVRHQREEAFTGVFDAVSASRKPAGALSRIRYADHGRFPTVRTTTKPGINGAPYIDGRNITERPQAEIRNAGEEDAGAVYFPRTDGATPPTDYYPDPAAESLVIRLRRAGTDTEDRGVLPGLPLVIPLRRPQRAYPFRETVLLTLDRDRGRDGPPSQQTILEDRGRRFIDATRSGNITTGQTTRHQAHEIVLRLDPGDQYDVEMWITPSAWRLAHDFAPVQGLVQYFCERGRREGDPDGVCTTAMLMAGIETEDAERLPAAQKALLLQHLKDSAEGSMVRYVGTGGAVLPPIRLVRALGKALHAMMLRHPLPEIAAVRRIAAIHAVNVPSTKHRPIVTALDTQLDPFPDSICPADNATDTPAPLRAVRPAEMGQEVTGFSDASAIASGSKLFALKGQVRIDPERVDTLEFVARTVSPQSAIFDDPGRGRSLARRIAGTWPMDEREGGQPEGFRRASGIFGFKLAADGRTALEESEVTLLRIDSLPFAKAGDTSQLIDVAPYFLGLRDRLVSRRHVFPDGKARHLEIRVNALARTAELMSTAARVARRGDPWLNPRFSGLVYQEGDLIPAESLPRDLMINLSAPVNVILPATVRPASVEAFAPVPVFEEHTPEITEKVNAKEISTRRRATVRIPLGRGWFSSGVDERLGIVLWPPQQSLADAPQIAENQIPLRSDEPSCATQPLPAYPGGICPANQLGAPPPPGPVERAVDLPSFEDGDLGPGGRFVTRRGADPVRMNTDVPPDESETHVFLSKEAFPDLWRHPADPNLAEYVPQVWMPVSDGGDETAQSEQPDGEDAPASQPADVDPPLSVGLVVYRPLFDPDREEWYVDVTLSPGTRSDSFVRFGLVRYQPHTRPDLRCSKPAVQWAQPLPDRHVRIEELPGEDLLQVTITGPVAKGRAKVGLLDRTSALERQMAERDAAVMRLTLFRDAQSPAGAAARVTLPLPPDIGTVVSGVETVDLIPEVTAGQGEWQARIPKSALPSLEDLSLAIDEIEYFPPASFSPEDEPLDAAFIETFKAELWAESGPRFATVLALAPFARKPARAQ